MKFNDTFNEDCIMTGANRKREHKEYVRKVAEVILRPTGEGQFYRFRLLNFPPDEEFKERMGLSVYRDFPFIPRYVHTAWIKTPDDKAPGGVKTTMKKIVCPASDYIMENTNLRKSNCPICSASQTAYAAYKDSGYTNQVAKHKNSACRNQFEVLVPVYLITDPNYDAANGSVKVLTLNKDQYNRLLELVRDATKNHVPIWNENAVDLYLTYGETEKTLPARNGKPEYTFTTKDILKMGFTTTPHEVANLENLIPALGFDENWFTIPEISDLQEFYAKYFATSGGVPNDIPDDIPLEQPKVSKPVVAVEQPKPVEVKPATKAPIVPDDIPADVPSDIPEDIPVEQPKKKAEPQKKAESVKPAVDTTADAKNIDDFLAKLNI